MGTVLQQGKFTSAGVRKVLSIRSDVDWMYVYNYNAINQTTADLGAVFYWQRGMAQGRGIVTTKLGATQAQDATTIGQIAAQSGFYLINQGSDALVSGAVAFSAISDNVNPQVTTASLSASGVSLQTGDVVRLSQPIGTADAQDLLGIDFQITVNDNTHFTITNALQQAPGAAAVAAGRWRKVNVSSMFYPQTRYIVNITQAANAVVTTSVDHGYQRGQEIRFHINNAVNGMVELDGLIGTITAVTASTFTVDIDTTAFTAFTFPTIAAMQAIGSLYTPAFVGPVGANTAYSINNNLDPLTDAEVNISLIGMQLNAGVASPAGANGDVIYWVAGKSFAVTNE